MVVIGKIVEQSVRLGFYFFRSFSRLSLSVPSNPMMVSMVSVSVMVFGKALRPSLGLLGFCGLISHLSLSVSGDGIW